MFKQIEPLSIIKQILTGALAACDFSPSVEAVEIRRAVLDPNAAGPSAHIKVLTYLNPPRVGEDEDLALTTKRVIWNQPQLNVRTKRSMFTFAEYAHCPLGYVVVFTRSFGNMIEEAEQLADSGEGMDDGGLCEGDATGRVAVRRAAD